MQLRRPKEGIASNYALVLATLVANDSRVIAERSGILHRDAVQVTQRRRRLNRNSSVRRNRNSIQPIRLIRLKGYSQRRTEEERIGARLGIALRIGPRLDDIRGVVLSPSVSGRDVVGRRGRRQIV